MDVSLLNPLYGQCAEITGTLGDEYATYTDTFGDLLSTTETCADRGYTVDTGASPAPDITNYTQPSTTTQ